MALMKKLTSAVVASSLVLGLAGVAAATTPDKVQAAATRMQKLNLVKGVDASGTDLALNANLTRAQLVTILVRAFGQDANAKYLDGAAAFTDTANHPWASGYIAMAKRIIAERTNGKEVVGLPDGSFNPDGNVTAAEAVAFLMKFVGAPADSTKAWPDNYISGALNAGIITAEDKTVLDGIKNTPATRGLAFYLADRAFYGYKLAEGGTVYTTFVDPSAPTVTVDNADNSNTLEEKVTVTGTVSADVVSVTVGSLDNAATITDGKFTASVNLAIGENSILVHAVDRAGNASEKTVKVTRTVGAAASIEASDITVAAGGTAAVTATVKDAKGNAITGATVTGESTVGTFDGTSFKAGEKAGEGTLTLKVGEVTKSVKVTVTAADLAAVSASNATPAIGERVTLSAQDQYGNAVTGATFTVDSADALLDSTQGILIASKAGNYTVTATKNGKSATLKVGVYSSTVDDVAVEAPATMVGNSVVGADADSTTYGTEYTVTVKAVDKNGNLVANFDGPVTISLPTGFGLGEDEVGVKNAKNGVATFSVIAGTDTIGTQVDISAKFNAGTADELEASTAATVEVQEQVATSVKFDSAVTAKYIRANDSTGTTNVAAYIADQNGEMLLSQDGYVVNYSLTGPAKFTENDDVTLTKTYAGDEENVAINSIKGLTGAVTVTATVEGLGTATVTTTAAIATDAAAFTVKADNAEATANDKTTVTYSLQAVDKNGVPVVGAFNFKATFNSDATTQFTVEPVTVKTAPDADGNQAAVAAIAMDSDTGISYFSGYTDAATGKAKFTLTAHKFVGDLKVDISDVAKDLTTASTSVKFLADKPEFIKFTRDAFIKVSSGSPKATITAQVTDAAGNKAPVSGLKVTFTGFEYTAEDVNGDGAIQLGTETTKVNAAGSSDVTLNGTAKTVDVTTDANGVASVDASVLGYVGKIFGVEVSGYKADGVTELKGNATADPDTFVNDTLFVTVNNAVATSISGTATKVIDGALDTATAVSVTAGTPVQLAITVKDAASKKVAYDNVVVVPSGTAYEYDGTNANGDWMVHDADGRVAIDKEDGAVATYNPADGLYYVTVVPATSGTFTFTLKDTSAAADVTAPKTVKVTPAAADHFVVNGGDDLSVVKSTASGAVTLKLADLFDNARVATDKVYVKVEATNAADEAVEAGVRTSVSSADVHTLTIAAGTTSSTFYVYNSLPAGTYTLTFTQVDKDGNVIADGYTGTLTVKITAQ